MSSLLLPQRVSPRPKTPLVARSWGNPQTTPRSYISRQGIGGCEDEEHDPADEALAKAIYAGLIFYYPDHLWRVEVSHKQGVALIRLMMMSDVPYVLKIEDLKLLSNRKMVMQAGGELLERFDMPRAGFSRAEFAAAYRKFKPDFNRRKMVPG